MSNPLYVSELERKVQRLQQELDEIKSVEFQRRVEKVAEGWRGKCDRLQTLADNYFALLVEANAREAQLRETFKWIEKNATSPGDTWYLAQATRALALPTDDTALKARLKAERERVAAHFEEGHKDHPMWAGIAAAIRNLGDE